MKKILTLILLFTLSLFGASFDCTKAKTNVEKMICADPELSALDEKLNQVYKEALTKSNNKNKLIQEQREWIKERNEIFSSNLSSFDGFLDNRIIALQDAPPCSSEKEKLMELFQHFDFIDYGGRAEVFSPRNRPMIANWKKGKFELILPTFYTDNRHNLRLQKLEQQCSNVIKEALDYKDTYPSNMIKRYRYYDVNSTNIILERLVMQNENPIASRLTYVDMQKCKKLSAIEEDSNHQKMVEIGVIHYGTEFLTYLIRLDDKTYYPLSTHQLSPIYKGKKVESIYVEGFEDGNPLHGTNAIFSVTESIMEKGEQK